MNTLEETKCALTLGQKLLSLAADQSQWSQKTFGGDAARGPLGPLKHLAKEVLETQVAFTEGNPDEIQSEFADLLILLLDSSRRAGISIVELVDAARDKMVENKLREWPAAQGNDEPVEHIR